jgi:hypothetical protein
MTKPGQAEQVYQLLVPNKRSVVGVSAASDEQPEE